MQETHTGILDPSLCLQVPFKFKVHMLQCGRFGFPRGRASTSFFRFYTQGWLEKENLTQVDHSSLEWCWAGVGLGCLKRHCGGIYLPSLKDWARDKSDRPTLNSKNTQGSCHQLHLVLVPGRKPEIQSYAETRQRSHSSLEPGGCCGTLTFRLPVQSFPPPSSLPPHWPPRFLGQLSESGAAVWIVALYVALGPAGPHCAPVRSANSQVLPWMSWGQGPVRCTLSCPLGDPNALASLKTTGLDRKANQVLQTSICIQSISW